MILRKDNLNIEHSTSNIQLRIKTRRVYDLEERLLIYSANIIKLVEKLPDTRSGNHIAGQLLRSGTSPYPNHGEAQAAESQNDFIHKLKVSLKELRESKRWILLIIYLEMIIDVEKVQILLTETEELIKIFVSSIRTAEKNR